MSNDTERYAAEMFPSDYASWRYCIEVKCGIPLTADFLKARIAILGNPQHSETQRFAKTYGDAYHGKVLAWFKRAADEA